MNMQPQQDEFKPYLLTLVVVGALVRLLLIVWIHPASRPLIAEGDYMVTAQAIIDRNIHALGDRAPVYPLFLVLCGLNPRVVWYVQSVLGIAASVMIFDMALRRTQDGRFALGVGLACSLVPELFLYESSVMTEALSGFLLVMSFWLLTRTGGEEMPDSPFALGVVVALAGLTRPLLLCLAPIYLVFVAPLWPPSRWLQRQALRKALVFALPIVVGVLGWCGFNYFNNGFFSPTTRAGQQLMDLVDPYVALAPPRFALLRDAWLENRCHYNPTGLNTSEEVFEGTLLDVRRQTGESYVQISHDLATLAIYMEVHHPALCLRRAELGWIQFWGQPSSDEYLWPPDGRMRVTAFAMVLSNFLVRVAKGTFVLLALFSLPCLVLNRRVFTRLEYLTFAVALGVSAVASFAEYGDNRRFCVPLYMPIIFTVCARAWCWITAAEDKQPRALRE